jgi:hypothetical protein
MPFYALTCKLVRLAWAWSLGSRERFAVELFEQFEEQPVVDGLFQRTSTV